MRHQLVWFCICVFLAQGYVGNPRFFTVTQLPNNQQKIAMACVVLQAGHSLNLKYQAAQELKKSRNQVQQAVYYNVPILSCHQLTPYVVIKYYIPAKYMHLRVP